MSTLAGLTCLWVQPRSAVFFSNLQVCSQLELVGFFFYLRGPPRPSSTFFSSSSKLSLEKPIGHFVFKAVKEGLLTKAFTLFLLFFPFRVGKKWVESGGNTLKEVCLLRDYFSFIFSSFFPKLEGIE